MDLDKDELKATRDLLLNKKDIPEIKSTKEEAKGESIIE